MITELLDLLAPSGAQSAPPRVKLVRSGGSATAGAFGMDLLAALAGPALPDPLSASLTAVDVQLSAAPMLSSCRLRFLAQSDFPQLAPGDPLSVELGFGDQTQTVFSGPISVIGMHQGRMEILLGSSAMAFAHLRRNSGYENQSFADLLHAWAGEAKVEVGDIDAGPDYAFLAIDDRRSIWEWMARLACHAGVTVWVDADAQLNARAARGQPVGRWTWGEDILSLETAARDPMSSATRMLGEGSAGRQGSTAWAWLTQDAQGVSASADAVHQTDLVRLGVAGAPALDVAARFELMGCPGGYGDGVWTALEVRHHFSAERGFTTDAVGVRTT